MLALALERFSDLIPRPSGDRISDWLVFPGNRLCACLERDLIPALEPLWTSLSFQQLALWPIVTWLPDCDTPQRLLISQLKQAITLCAEATCDFAREHADLLNSHFPAAVRQWHKVNGVRRADASAPSVADALLTLERVKTRCQQEWVSAQDYFRPRFNVFVPGEGTQWDQRGEFIINFNPELRHVGNLIARCLLVRAITTIDLLQATTKEFEATLVAAQSPLDMPWREQPLRIRQLFTDLRQACLHAEDAVHAEAAMSMVQIGMEFSARRPDLDWLPPEATRSATSGQIRQTLEGKRDLPTALVIRESLATFEKWSAGRSTVESALEEAIATGNLIVVESSRDVYWRSRKLNADWHQHSRPWQLLLELARTRGRSTVTVNDLFDTVVSDSAFARLKNRLATMLPADLRALVIPVRPPNPGYQLDLPSQAIHFFPAEPHPIHRLLATATS